MKLGVNIKELRLSTSVDEKVLLKDICFTLEERNIYTILGKNGSGKSTLIRSFAGLLDNRFYKIDGSVMAGDINVVTATGKELVKIRREKIKYVFQDAINSFDPLRKTGYCFKRFNVDKDEAEELLRYFLLPALKQIGKLYPYELSGGMAQRFSMVLALLMRPDLLILDEPTSGIDPVIANLFRLKIKEYSGLEQKTVLLVTQDMDFAKSLGGFTAHISDGNISPFVKCEDYFRSENTLFKTERNAQ
jgi:ABC-type glutathione transport system ATPase component